MNRIYRDAILKASETRKRLKANMFQPINIFDSCISLGLDVKFVDVNMEGLYVNQGGRATILISNQRPFPRRCFTAGHELGHHIFNHGFKLDILSDEKEQPSYKDQDEILVDAFAAALLMPVGGIQAEFTKRNWNFQDALPIDFYTISSIFGVGYQTLITHCRVNGLINDVKSNMLMKLTPSKIFRNYFGKIEDKSFFKIIDGSSVLTTVDLEVSNYLISPSDMKVDGDKLEKLCTTEIGCLYIARRTGIESAYSLTSKCSYFVRIQRGNYIGFAEYRHLED